jgi:hypothetical protein
VKAAVPSILADGFYGTADAVKTVMGPLYKIGLEI